VLSSAAPSEGGRFGPKGWPVYSERPADLLRKPGFFTPRYPTSAWFSLAALWTFTKQDLMDQDTVGVSLLT